VQVEDLRGLVHVLLEVDFTNRFRPEFSDKNINRRSNISLLGV
jgi:hypothetical protein